MKIYPENATSAFTVLLPQKITLHGKWYVGIAELHYNYNFFNVTREHSEISIDYEIKPEISENNYAEARIWTLATGITPGYYTRITDIVDEVNGELKRIMSDKTHTVDENILTYNKINSRVYVDKTKIPSMYKSVTFSERLALQLGFKPDSNILECKISPFAANIRFGVPDQMFFYTDIIEPTFIGHERAYVLKIINTQPLGVEFGSSCYKEFEDIHYMTVQKREFESIAIDIRDSTGDNFPFLHGVSAVKLHFKKHDG